MIEKARALLQRYPIHSKAIVIGFFSVIFIILIAATLGTRVSDDESRSVNPTPTPRALIPGEDYAEGQVLVKFRENLTDSEISEILLEYDARIESTISGINVKVVEVPVGQEKVIVEKLTNEGVVEYAELDAIGGVQVTYNDPDFSKQYGLVNTGQNIQGQSGTVDSDIDIEEAWDLTTGEGIRVAVLDTGIDLTHPEFASKVVASKAFASSSLADSFGHGTHVAGIAAAGTNNSQGISGTCPGCQLLIGKVLRDDGKGESSDVSKGFLWAVENGAQVINLSLVFNQRVKSMEDAVKNAWANDVVVVAAAGNCGDSNYANNFCTTQNQVMYPAGFEETVSVAATDNRDKRASFSNHGSTVDVAAPGNAIYSTLPVNGSNYGSNYAYLNGTSMASPMVAGVVALVRAANPNFTNQQVVDRLFETADPIEGTGTLWQYGRVNAARAVATQSAVPSPSVTIVPTEPVGPTDPVGPTEPVGPTDPIDPSITEPPPFVCGGSPDNICTSPTVTIPPIDDGEDCLDPRSGREKINSWVDRFILRVRNYINAVIGNPQQPPPPPVPCVVR